MTSCYANDNFGARVRNSKARIGQPAVRVLARAGLAARGVIYVLIGWVAILVALGKTKQQADQRGALQLLSGKPYGLVSLWLLCIGFAAYALWRLSEAAFGITVDGNGAGQRLKSLGRAVGADDRPPPVIGVGSVCLPGRPR